MMMKTCTECGVPKPLTCYSRGTAKCKPCRVKLAERYRPRRKPPLDGWRLCSRCGERKPATAQFFRYEKRVLDRCKSQCRSCELAVRDRPAEVARALRWARSHPEAVKLREARRRARKLAVPNTLTRDEWQAILDYYGGRCAYCLKVAKLQMDHVVPFAAGGSNSADNVVPACAACNASKKAKSLLAWMLAAA